MVKHSRLRNACLRALTIRSEDVDDEYGLGGSPTQETPVAPARTTWTPGRLVYPGEVIEPTLENGFTYKAVQAAPAYTGTAEPAWPVIAGNTVVDGGVTWQAVAKTSIVWTAIPLYKSGATEPAWSTVFGGTVNDNGITWTATTNAITDSRCPQHKVALSIASKVFSPYRDVLRFCATDDPTDWSSANDAGFLPVGQHAPTSPEVTALGEFRGRMAVWTTSNLQLWTVDPDPAEMSIYDSIPGLGTVYDKGVASVGGDLYYTTKQGIRSLSLSASSNNLAAGDIGSGIDPLIVAKLAGPDVPLATYYPGNGQFWVIFGSEAFVYTKSALGKVGAWSRYLFPWTIEAAIHLNGELILRANDAFYRLDENVTHDDGVEFEGVVWTPYLDMGNPGVTKAINGIDIVAYGTLTVSIGYNQLDTSQYTAPFAIGPDTVPGGTVPFGVAAPSMAVKLVFAGGQSWQLNAMTLYLDDFGLGV